MEIDIKVKMPYKTRDEYKQPSLCEKIREYIEVCESEDSDYHWRYLCSVYKLLKKKPKLTDELNTVMAELQDFLSKNNEYSSDDNHIEIEGSDMFKYKDSRG